MEKIQANIILEILGRPKENVTSALAGIVEKLSGEKGLIVKEKKLHEPVLVKDSKDLFTAFAEIQIECDSLLDYFLVIFSYMPSFVEIIYPEKMNLKNSDLTLIGTKLAQRLHDYDAVVKNTLMQKDIITRKLFEVAPHLFKKQEQTPQTPQNAENAEKPSAEIKESRKSKKKNKKQKKN